MFLKLKEFVGISFRREESVSLSIVHVGPCLVALVCIPPFVGYRFRVCLNSGFFILIYFRSSCIACCFVWVRNSVWHIKQTAD